MNLNRRFLAAVAVLAAAGGSLAALPARAQLTAPEALSQPQPPSLRNQAGDPIDGWVIVRYSVLQDGTTADVNVVDAVPPVADTGAVVASVGQWRFEPAMSEGQAIDWHNTESVVVFSRDDAPVAPSASFEESYAEIQALLEAEAYSEARDAAEALLNRSRSHSELGLALAQQAIASLGLADLHGALAYLRLASDPRIPVLPSAELLSALQLRFQIESQLGRFPDALETYQRIDHALGPEVVNPFDGPAALLTEEWETADALPVQALVESMPWRIGVADRRTFTVADVSGEIRGIDVECERRVARLPFQPDAEWSLPDSWGNCELFFDADPETSFIYYSFLDTRPEPE